MLNCSYCDYFKSITMLNKSSERKTLMCDFTGHIFAENVEELDIEYPCKPVSYWEYLNKNKSENVSGIILQSDWKLAYRRPHAKPVKDRNRITA